MTVINNNTFGKAFGSTDEIPDELKNQLFQSFRQKLPPEVEDAVIYDIMLTNIEIIKNYFLSLK